MMPSISGKKIGLFFGNVESNSIIGFVLNNISLLLSIIIIPFILNELGPTGWGYYSFFLLCVSIMSFVESALQIYICQAKSESLILNKTYSWITDPVIQTFSAYFFIAIIVISFFALNYFASNNLEIFHILAIASVTNVVFRCLTAASKGFLQSNKRQSRYFLFTSLANVLRQGLLLTSAYVLDFSILDLVSTYILISVVESALFLKLSGSIIIRQTDSDNCKKQRFTEFYYLLLANLISVVTVNVDKILVYAMSEIYQAGTYNIASTAASLLYMLANVFIVALAPVFKELHIKRDDNHARALFTLFSGINTFFVSSSIYAFFAIIKFYDFADFRSVDIDTIIDVFTPLSLGALLLSNLWIPGILATSKGSASFSFWQNLFFLCAYLSSFAVLKRLFGEPLFAESFLISALLTFVPFILYFMKNILTISPVYFLIRAQIIPLFLSFAIIGPFAFFGISWPAALHSISSLLMVIIIHRIYIKKHIFSKSLGGSFDRE